MQENIYANCMESIYGPYPYAVILRVEENRIFESKVVFERLSDVQVNRMGKHFCLLSHKSSFKDQIFNVF